MQTKYRYNPNLYYILTFSITFLLWFAGAYASHQERGSVYMTFMLAGLIVPFIISLIFILRSDVPAMKKDFVRRLIDPRLINVKMLPPFFLIMPAAVVISIGISIIFGGSTEQLSFSEGFSFSSGFVPVLFLLMLTAIFEELGWRGYAFDSLLSRIEYFGATILFGVMWSLWHLPLIWVKDSYQYEILNQNPWYAINFFAGIVPLGIIISWFCIKNKKSIIAAALFHFIVNMSQEALQMTQTTKCIETAVLTLFAILIVIYDRKMFFSKENLHEG